MEVKTAPSLREYFHNAVSRAMTNQKVEATEMATSYLVLLLSDFASTPIPEEALALKMCSGLTKAPSERMQTLKEVGDTSLFVSGYFPDSLNSSLVDVDYYIGIGEVAYGSLGRLARTLGRSSSFGQVFCELSTKFPRFVDVLAEVAAGSAIGSPVDI